MEKTHFEPQFLRDPTIVQTTLEQIIKRKFTANHCKAMLIFIARKNFGFAVFINSCDWKI